MVTKKSIRPKTAAKKNIKKTPPKSKSVAKKKATQPQLVSFRLSKDSTPFNVFKITEQTIYWGILLIYVLLLSLWILRIQIDTLLIIDRIDAML